MGCLLDRETNQRPCRDASMRSISAIFKAFRRVLAVLVPRVRAPAPQRGHLVSPNASLREQPLVEPGAALAHGRAEPRPEGPNGEAPARGRREAREVADARVAE